MTTFSLRRPACLLFVLVASALALSAPAQAAPPPWSMTVATGDRMLLNYPTWMSREDAQSFLEDRQRALAFAESYLGVTFAGRIIYTIETTLLAVGGTAVPSLKGGEILFYLPYGTLPQSESHTLAAMTGGCHEEVHLVSAFPFHWDEEDMLEASPALREGIAEWVSAEYTGMKAHRPFAAALLESGRLYDLQTLLCPADEEPLDPYSLEFTVDLMNVYKGGAAFIEYLMTSFDVETLLLMLGRSQCPLDGLVVDVQDGEEIMLVLPFEERLWHGWMSDWSSDLTARGRHLMDIWTRTRSWESPIWLEQTWQESPYELVAPSVHAASRYVDLIAALNEFAASSDTASLAEDAAELHAQVDRLEVLLTSWQDAVVAYEEALELAVSDADNERLAQLLETAEAGYALAGDTFMAIRAFEWLEELGKSGD